MSEVVTPTYITRTIKHLVIKCSVCRVLAALTSQVSRTISDFFNFNMYTTIIHPLRKQLKLSVKEYIVLDAVYFVNHLQGKRINAREIAELFDLTKSSVEYSIKKLIKMGYLQKNRYNRNVSVTELIKIAFLKN